MSETWQSLYPFCSQHLSLGDVRMHYVDEGEGRPLLFVHGNPTWSFYWRELILATRETHRAIAVDHVGCGLSDKPAKYEYTLERHIQNLTELVERLELREVTLLCHDWGGSIGLGVATRQPDRIRSVVLLNTGAFPPPYIPWRIRACRIPWLGTLGIRGLNLFSRAALVMASSQRQLLTPAIKAGLLAPYDSWANRVAVDGFVKDIPASPAHPTWEVLRQIEDGLQMLSDKRMKLIWGMKDWCFTEVCLRRFEEHFPNAESVRLPDAGHYVVEDATERVVEEVKSFVSD